jgi:hypothetical protein
VNRSSKGSVAGWTVEPSVFQPETVTSSSMHRPHTTRVVSGLPTMNVPGRPQSGMSQTSVVAPTLIRNTMDEYRRAYPKSLARDGSGQLAEAVSGGGQVVSV